MDEYRIPAPAVMPETKPFWDAAAEGKLLVMRCTACGEHYHYPRPLCPFCFSDRTEWRTASGRGTVYSYSVMRRAKVPYAMAYVTLEEGPVMLTHITGCDLDTVRIGETVEVVFKPSDGGPPVPMFKPVR